MDTIRVFFNEINQHFLDYIKRLKTSIKIQHNYNKMETL